MRRCAAARSWPERRRSSCSRSWCSPPGACGTASRDRHPARCRSRASAPPSCSRRIKRARHHHGLEPRLPEPGDAARRAGHRPGTRPGGRARRDLGRVRERARRQGTVRPRVRGGADRVHRAREGALAAVSDLADPGRTAGSGPPRRRGVGSARGRPRPDTALVPVRYWELALEFDTAASWLVLARDLVLLALLAVLALGLRERHANGLAGGRAT